MGPKARAGMTGRSPGRSPLGCHGRWGWLVPPVSRVTGGEEGSLQPHGGTLGSAAPSGSALRHAWRRRTLRSPEALGPAPARVRGRLLARLAHGGKALRVPGGGPAPAPGPHGRRELWHLSGAEDGMRGPRCCEGAERPPPLSASARALAVAPQAGCGAAQARRPSRAQPRQHPLPEEDGTRTDTAAKSQKSAPRGRRALDNGGPHKGSAWTALFLLTQSLGPPAAAATAESLALASARFCG
jgi:hypothetical protein